MTDSLVAMYKRGAITANHLVGEMLHMLDPAHPEIVLDSIPPEALEALRNYLDEYQPRRMRSNYELQPAVDQVEAAKHWMEAKVEK
jgi:hypothetical protein